MKTKSIERVRRHRQKIKIKRIRSKMFDEQCKRKIALIQQKWRKNKQQKQQQNIETATLSSLAPTTTTASDLRKKEGLRRRRTNISKLRNENEQLHETIRQLTIENKRLETLQSQTSSRPSPTKLLLDNISSSAKKRAIIRLKEQKEHLQRGSACDLTQKFGINLSIQNQPKKKKLLLY